MFLKKIKDNPENSRIYEMIIYYAISKFLNSYLRKNHDWGADFEGLNPIVKDFIDYSIDLIRQGFVESVYEADLDCAFLNIVLHDKQLPSDVIMQLLISKNLANLLHCLDDDTLEEIKGMCSQLVLSDAFDLYRVLDEVEFS